MTSPTLRPSLLLATVVALIVGTWGVVVPAPAASAARYSPQPGVTTNDPLAGPGERRAIVRKVLRTIDSAPRRSQIRVASWNIRSGEFVDALIRAHRRHVGVRVILDRGNANPDNVNREVDRLQTALRRGNASRKPYLRSRVKKCVSSCRGTRGIAHSKFFTFTRAGSARWVVINGSWNATDVANASQWNDVFTIRGRRAVHDRFRSVFAQMWADRPVRQGYLIDHYGSLSTLFLPYTGARTGKDPVLRELDRVRCTGARNQAGGRTKIRIAMTSWYGARGIAIAKRVRQLANRGCDVRIVYAVMGNEVLRILRREGPRPVPLQQIVQDFDGDGIYDRYLHSKVLTIKGHYRGNRRAWITLNGSANWAPATLASDEAVLRLRRPAYLRRYNTWIDRLFANPPRSVAPRIAARAVGPVDPYAKVEEN